MLETIGSKRSDYKTPQVISVTKTCFIAKSNGGKILLEHS